MHSFIIIIYAEELSPYHQQMRIISVSVLYIVSVKFNFPLSLRCCCSVKWRSGRLVGPKGQPWVGETGLYGSKTIIGSGELSTQKTPCPPFTVRPHTHTPTHGQP